MFSQKQMKNLKIEMIPEIQIKPLKIQINSNIYYDFNYVPPPSARSDEREGGEA